MTGQGILLLAVVIASAAPAAEPVVTRGDTHIEAHVDVAAEPSRVMALVRDPEALARLDPESKATVETQPDGDCLLVTTHVEHPIARATYQTRSCSDGDLGVHATLVGGAAMKEFDARWTVAPHEGGSRLHYRIRAVAALPVPQFVVDRATARGTERLLGRIRDHFAAPRPAP